MVDQRRPATAAIARGTRNPSDGAGSRRSQKRKDGSRSYNVALESEPGSMLAAAQKCSVSIRARGTLFSLDIRGKSS